MSLLDIVKNIKPKPLKGSVSVLEIVKSMKPIMPLKGTMASGVRKVA